MFLKPALWLFPSPSPNLINTPQKTICGNLCSSVADISMCPSVNSTTLVTAPWVLPVTLPPIQDGAIAFSQDGTILDCGPWQEVRKRFPAIPEQRYEAVLVPGFVNTHCHLELSHLRGQLRPGNGLPSFIRQVTELRNTDSQRIEQGIQDGLQELQREGIVGVVDIGNTGRSLPFLQSSGLYGLFLLELIKFDSESAERVFEQGRMFLNNQERREWQDMETQRLKDPENYPPSQYLKTRIVMGLTGHATYSCSESLLRRVASHAFHTKIPLSLHLLESLEERALIEQGRGFFAEHLGRLGYFLDTWKVPGISPLFYAEHCLGPRARRLYVHLIHIREDELHYLATQSDVFIALCPKSNLFIEEKLPPIDQIAKTHPRITIGTDSLSSNDRLSILDELRTIQSAFPNLSSTTLIQWATLNGARYLGLEKILGSLTPGKRPGILAILTSHLNPNEFLIVENLSLLRIDKR